MAKQRRQYEQHGLTGTRPYHQYHGMLARCYNPNSHDYKWYGARGIKVCEEWLTSFIAFNDHVKELPNYDRDGYWIERIENDKGYYPGNIMYATPMEQANNRRTKKPMTDIHKQRISEALTGKVHSDDTRKKMRITHSGKALGDEHKKKIGEANKGKRRTPEQKAQMKQAQLDRYKREREQDET